MVGKITMTGFNTSHPDFDAIKYIRQLRCIARWMACGARATIEAATGFGKTAVGLIAIAKMMKFNSKTLVYGNTVLVVVPTTKLKTQWRKTLRKAGFDHVEVQVINTVSLSENFVRNVDLLILDEVHLMAADKFRRVFARVQYSWVLGLTATVERLDGKHDFLAKHAPVCDVITQKEAIFRRWISDFIEFNLSVPITRAEAQTQVNLGKQIRYYMSRFGSFNKMLDCMEKGNAKRYAQQINRDPNEVIKWATQGIRLIHKRKEFLDTTEHKIRAAVELITEFGTRTITFSQSTVFAEAIVEALGPKICKPYHSKIPTITRMVTKSKIYKTEKGAKNRKLKLIEDGYKATFKPRKSDWIVSWKVPEKVSGNRQAEENSDAFEKGKLLVLASAKALDQGFDVPDVLLGVDGSRSENPTQHTQRTGRVARTYYFPNGKKATKVYVNLYIPDWSVPNSRDEQKLRACQKKNSDNVVWVDSLDELKEMLNAILKKRGETQAKTDGENREAVSTIVEGSNCDPYSKG